MAMELTETRTASFRASLSGSKDRMLASRFELKYMVSEQKARQIAHYVSSFLELDENGMDQPNGAYPVHSIYIDSDGMKTYWDTINGNRNRMKLRVRFYNDDPEAPAFLEIKRRVNNCIQKMRVGVRREAVSSVLQGKLPHSSLVFGHSPKDTLALETFCHSVLALGARPKMHIAYSREAYLPPHDESARVTLDRQVRFEPAPTARLSTVFSKPQLVWGQNVVLEMKFTDRYPNWFRGLVQQFNLMQCGAAKYCDAVTLFTSRTPQQPVLRPQLSPAWLPEPDRRREHSVGIGAWLGVGEGQLAGLAPA